jgi:Leucine-rich repeat (LRR) protein
LQNTRELRISIAKQGSNIDEGILNKLLTTKPPDQFREEDSDGIGVVVSVQLYTALAVIATEDIRSMIALEETSKLHQESLSRAEDECAGHTCVSCSRVRARKTFSGDGILLMVSRIRMIATLVILLLQSISSRHGVVVQSKQPLLQREPNVVPPSTKECRDILEQTTAATSTRQRRSRTTPFHLTREIECQSRHFFDSKHSAAARERQHNDEFGDYDFDFDEFDFSREGYLAHRTMQRHLARTGGSTVADTVSIDATGAVEVFDEGRRLQINTTTTSTDPASQNSDNNRGSNQRNQQQQQRYAEERQALVSFYKATTGEQWTNRFGWDSINYIKSEKEETRNEVNAEEDSAEQQTVDTILDSKELLSPSDITGSSVAEPSYNTNSNINPAANMAAVTDFATHCVWYGIECDPDTNLVTSVVLIKNNLQGMLSSASEFTALISLEVLALSENKLSGILPSFMGDFAESLTELYLRDNDFRGAIPSELQQLVQLKALVLSENNFQGGIPSQVHDMKNLTKLDIGNNKLSGPFPWSLLQTDAGLPALTDLLLDGNAFTGTIPDLDANVDGVSNEDKVIVSNLRTDLLRQLHVARNRLTGHIPESLGRQFASLRKLSLGSNALVGTIPSSVAKMSHMVGLDLSQNRLTGTVPHQILQNMTKLKLLDLRQNLLSGELPLVFLLDEGTTSSSYSVKSDQNADADANSNEDNNDSAAASTNRTTADGGSSSKDEPAQTHFNTHLQYLFLGGNEFTGAISPQAIHSLSASSLLQILDLSNNDLTGKIPTTISELVKLEQLLLSGNGFFGEIPTKIGNLKELTVLSLASNKLRGEIPTQIGNLTNLQVLHLSDNVLNSTIPTEIGYLTELKTLLGSRNKFTGVLPTPQLFQLVNLKSLFMDGNRLRGTLPEPELGNLNQLHELSIAGNRFEGTLPFKSLAKLTDLEYFDCRSNELNGTLQFDVWGGGQGQQGRKLSILRMSYNQFTGNLDGIGALSSALATLELQSNYLQGFLPPQDLSVLTSLQTLDLQGNRFSGTVPTQISGMISLAVLDLRDNGFTGSLPSLIVDNTKNVSSSLLAETLERLYLANNSLEGTIGSNIGRLKALKELQLQNNKFVGGLPDELQQLQQLQELLLEGNRLETTLPTFLGTLLSLRVLSLGQNQIRGTIPSQLGNLGANLDHLSLKGNMLRGTIPSELSALSSLAVLDLSNNKLLGKLPNTLSQMSSLRSLDLSSNSLSGAMPPAMFSLVRLENLKLARNFFSGPISTRFGDLVMMRNLDLSGNQFTGVLPAALARMTMLRELRIANQTSAAMTIDAGQSSSVSSPNTRDGISGEIPVELGDLLSLQVLDVSGNCLEGNIPPELGRLIRLQSLDLSSNDLSGYIPSEIGTTSLPALDSLALDENEG